MSETARPPKLNETIFDSLRTDMQAGLAQFNAATARLTNLETDAEAAREAAFAPFAEPIAQAKQAMHEVASNIGVEAVLERLKDLPQDEVEAAAFSFLMADKSLQQLANQYVQGLRGNEYDRSSAERTFAQLDGFAQFYRTLTTSDEPLPVLAIDLSWQEATDIQAEHEGRKSGAGEYEKACNLTLGSVSSRAIEMEWAEDTDDFNIAKPPVGLNLNFPPDSKKIVSQQEWGCIESTTETCEGVSPLVLARSPEYGQGFNEPINWSAGRQPDLSMMEQRPQLYGGSKWRRKESESYIIYGDNIEVALQELLSDDDLPESTKREIQKLI